MLFGKAINFNHDEVRGMARDSRSLRSGLSNAQLLAKDFNTLQQFVSANDPSATAIFWRAPASRAPVSAPRRPFTL